MSFSAQAVANYFLGLARRDGVTLSPMKLQKLVYFAHGWYLALAEEPLLNESVEAWSYGPVVPSLYHSVKHCGAGPIEQKLTRHRPDGEVFHPAITDKRDPNHQVRDLIEKVWETHGDLTAGQLSRITHEENSPWDRVYTECKGKIPLHKDIPDQYIKDYFRLKAKKK